MNSGSVTIEAVKTKKQRNDFIRFQWTVYKDDPLWVPPLIMERKAFIDPKKNPFFLHAEVELFLARDAGRIVGRIAAIVNHKHNEVHNDRVGFFGLLECLDRYDVAEALFKEAGAWLKDRGMDVMRGPASYSVNEEIGLLVEGFDESPMLLMPYNPPYYAGLIERYGFAKAMDMYAYIRIAYDMPERLYRITEKLKARNRFTIRNLNMKNLDSEIRLFKKVYSEAWEKNWGYVPMIEEEIDHMAKELKQILDPDLVFFAFVGDEMAGFSLTLPDINQALKKINGRLFPFGLFKLLYHSKKIDQARVLLLGVLEKYRHLGIDGALYMETFKTGVKKGIKRGEFSWILEDNAAMQGPLLAIGAEHYKTYRMYDVSL